MELGAFSLSLTVKDLAASREFYGKLGFEPRGGDGQQWQILSNGATLIGLFQGMFDKNMLTFTPGWDAMQNTPEGFIDVRELARTFKAEGLELSGDTTEQTPSGPASFMLMDPDGNPVLIDQHV